MLFTLEALDADHGDALLIHYRDRGEPRMLIIDGGPRDVYELSIRPRLEEIAFLRNLDLPLDADFAMVSHVDTDHIIGIIDLLQDPDPAVRLGSLWHNSFDDVIGNTTALEDLAEQSEAEIAESGVDPWTLGLAAGVKEGRQLRQIAIARGLLANAGVDGHWVDAGDQVQLAEGLTLRIVGPQPQQLQDLREKWDDMLRDIPGLAPAARREMVASFADRSIANLASIVAVAEMGGATMLLTGDARGDTIKAGLEQANLFDNGRAHFDLFKVPHHGSDRNVTEAFFREVTADHYVFSGNGKHGNPDTATLRMLTRARGDAEYSMHFTYRLPNVVEFFRQERARGDRHHQHFYREVDYFSVWVDLGDEELDY